MKWYISFLLVLLALGFQSCENPNAVLDEQLPIESTNWTYDKPIRIKVNIDDNRIPYSIFVNLRHTADYKYSNIFFRIHQINPDKKSISFRKEYRLSNPDGEWLGRGSGNLYSYILPLFAHYRFPAKGTYIFVIEQNMRDNPLREISDVGLRIEKAK